MKLLELFITETTEEDRAIISLSNAIYSKLKDEYIDFEPDYTDEDQELIEVGKIGDLFDTPIHALNNVSIQLQGGEPFKKRAVVNYGTTVYGFYDDAINSIVFNLDHLSSGRIKTAVTHELRHALDQIKSNGFPASINNPDPDTIHRYFTPKKKSHRKNDPYSTVKYRAKPAEINARFSELLHNLSVKLPRLKNRFPPDQLNDQLVKTLNNLFTQYEIADLFPEKYKSKDYKRLVNRAYDFMKKELDHLSQS